MPESIYASLDLKDYRRLDKLCYEWDMDRLQRMGEIPPSSQYKNAVVDYHKANALDYLKGL